MHHGRLVACASLVIIAFFCLVGYKFLRTSGSSLSGDARISAMIRNSDPSERRRGVFEIRDMILEKREAAIAQVAILSTALEDGDATVRRAAAVSLQDIGQAAEPAREALNKAVIKFPAADAAFFSINALKNIGIQVDEANLLLDYVSSMRYEPQRRAALSALDSAYNLVDASKVSKRLGPAFDQESDPLSVAIMLRFLDHFPSEYGRIREKLIELADEQNAMKQQLVLDFLRTPSGAVDVDLHRSLITKLKQTKFMVIKSQVDKL